MRIGIFGGAFDPIHIGHVNVANSVIRHNSVDKVIVVPTMLSPHAKAKNMEPLQHRVMMSVMELDGRENMWVSDAEYHVYLNNCDAKDPRRPTYAYDMVNRVILECESNPMLPSHNEYKLIVGSDTLPKITEWYRWEDLLRQVSLVVYPRKGHEIDLKKLYKNADRLKSAVKIEILFGSQTCDCSSTKIRRDLAKNRSSHFTSARVEKYIKSNNLYEE